LTLIFCRDDSEISDATQQGNRLEISVSHVS
jgi:hypothetical protein